MTSQIGLFSYFRTLCACFASSLFSHGNKVIAKTLRIRTLQDQRSLTKVQKMPADTLLGIDEKHFADTDTQNLKLRTENVVI